MAEQDKPVVKLIGEDGNAYYIIGACHKAAMKAGWTDERWQEVQKQMMSGTYDDLLCTAMRYFEVE